MMERADTSKQWRDALVPYASSCLFIDDPSELVCLWLLHRIQLQRRHFFPSVCLCLSPETLPDEGPLAGLAKIQNKTNYNGSSTISRLR